ncbi:FmdB family protein [Xanthomonas phage Xoo-sp13]|nr:FmdB family protein [Xanthomonas phage Xoo-sp13]
MVTSSTENSQKCDCEEDAPMVRDNRVYASGITLKGNWFKNNGQY